MLVAEIISMTMVAAMAPKTIKRTPLTSENLEEARRLKGLYESSKHGLSQAEFGARHQIGTQGAVWQFLNGVAALTLKSAKGFALGLDCQISDFSPRLAAEIEELSRSVKQTQPALVVTAAAVQPERLRMRPALQRAMLNTITKLAGAHCEVKEEFRLKNGQTVDIALLDRSGKARVLVECKSYNPSLGHFYKPAYLSGECWLMKHDAQGLPIEDGSKLFHIALLENSDVASAPNPTEAKLQASYRQLIGGKLLDGFALLRVADMPNGEIQLYDLPEATETMARLLEIMKQATQ